MSSNHLILCRSFHPPLVFPSIRVFSNESDLFIRWLTYWSFSINSSTEYSGLISLRIDWFDHIAAQGTLKSLLQHHSSRVSGSLAFRLCMVQLSQLYMTSGKPIALTMRTFVGKIMYLLFNMLSRFVIAFLLRSKHLLISCLQSPFAVILKPKKIKSLTVSIVSPSVCHEVMGLDVMILERHRDINIYLKYEVLSCMLMFIYFSIIWILFSIIASPTWHSSWWGQQIRSVKVWFKGLRVLQADKPTLILSQESFHFSSFQFVLSRCDKSLLHPFCLPQSRPG